MNKKILFVDDDANILQAYRRQLRKKFDLHMVQGPEAGLELIAGEETFAVVVSDFAMPGMDGVEFLSEVKKHSPDSVRIMLTGFANATNAIKAVNEGNIFRFLAKPCPPEQLLQSLQAGLDQYRLITAEKELLEKTLFGSVEVMSQILSLVNPVAFSSTSRIKAYMGQMADALALPGRWRYELAAMLCQLGYITLPPETTSKILADQSLSEKEQKIFDAHPSVTASMLEKIPRLGEVAEMVKRQQCSYRDYRQQEDALPDDPAILGGLMLRAALDFNLLISRNMSPSEAVKTMRRRRDVYHPKLLDCLASMKHLERDMEVRAIGVKDVTAYMVADQDIRTTNGLLLIAKGQEVSQPILERLWSFSKTTDIAEPFRMRIP